MRTKPTGDDWHTYIACTKGEFFWCAKALYQLQKGEDAPISGLKAFVKAEARRWLR